MALIFHLHRFDAVFVGCKTDIAFSIEKLNFSIYSWNPILRRMMYNLSIIFFWIHIRIHDLVLVETNLELMDRV
jgi:hypothetical protein